VLVFLFVPLFLIFLEITILYLSHQSIWS